MRIYLSINLIFRGGADIVISNGVLHHTADCISGVKKSIDLLNENGKIFLGLYHKFGRKPFLDYFAQLKEAHNSIDYLFSKYRELDARHDDSLQDKSWFMDQVMHPFETQHTLEEIMAVFRENGVTLIATSINNYQSWDNLADLYALEKEIYEVGKAYLAQNKYYPGFFYVLGQKNG